MGEGAVLYPESFPTRVGPTRPSAGWLARVITDERAELVRLRRANRVLEMENEILKRAAAFFARENVLPK